MEPKPETCKAWTFRLSHPCDGETYLKDAVVDYLATKLTYKFIWDEDLTWGWDIYDITPEDAEVRLDHCTPLLDEDDTEAWAMVDTQAREVILSLGGRRIAGPINVE